MPQQRIINLVCKFLHYRPSNWGPKMSPSVYNSKIMQVEQIFTWDIYFTEIHGNLSIMTERQQKKGKHEGI